MFVYVCVCLCVSLFICKAAFKSAHTFVRVPKHATELVCQLIMSGWWQCRQQGALLYGQSVMECSFKGQAGLMSGPGETHKLVCPALRCRVEQVL